MNIILIILVFQLLIFIHELGHFLAAKKCGVEVEEFSLGMPPKILSKKIGKTLYCLSLLPIGGYVKMKGFIVGENPAEASNFVSKTISQRFAIMLAGPLFNILLAYLLLVIVFWLGVARPLVYSLEPIVGKTATEKSVFQEDDLILQIENQSVQNWEELYTQVVQIPQNNHVQVVVNRKGKIVEFQTPVSIFSAITPRINPVIGIIFKNSEAEKIGMQVGDRILAINGQEVQQWANISSLLQQEQGKGVLLLDRNGSKIELHFQAKRSEASQKWVLGISLPSNKVQYSFFGSFSKSWQAIIKNITDTYRFLARLFIGKSSTDAVGGPITIFATINHSINQGFANLLYITAIISLQLAIFNLLPIPALDGGHIALLIVEKIKGKPVSLKRRKQFQALGFFLLMLLLVFITTKDISRFWG